ncbi:MAG: flagellar hook-basal body protein [Clostridiaceae bacterium]|nr:flagellar hook-basal body protein [Clostridiaceae bacterium]
MENAVYAAASGMSTWSRTLDITANNLANANTPGFKSQRIAIGTFGEHVTSRIGGSESGEIGSTTRGSAPQDIYSSSKDGTIVQSGKSTDLAIVGKGYFAIEQDGEIRLSRDGGFSVNADGYLVNSAGSRVLGEQGAINVGDGQFKVSENGTVTTADGTAGKLRIVVPQDEAAAQRLGDGTYSYNGTEEAFTGSVAQGMMEISNVEIVDEMTSMMEASRAFQSCSQILKILDSVNQRMVTEIGKV